MKMNLIEYTKSKDWKLYYNFMVKDSKKQYFVVSTNLYCMVGR
jgi:hypothetical protein